MTNELHGEDDLARAVELAQRELGGVVVYSGAIGGWRDSRSKTSEHAAPDTAHQPRANADKFSEQIIRTTERTP
jgi:hypothetical protein